MAELKFGSGDAVFAMDVGAGGRVLAVGGKSSHIVIYSIRPHGVGGVGGVGGEVIAEIGRVAPTGNALDAGSNTAPLAFTARPPAPFLHPLPPPFTACHSTAFHRLPPASTAAASRAPHEHPMSSSAAAAAPPQVLALALSANATLLCAGGEAKLVQIWSLHSTVKVPVLTVLQLARCAFPGRAWRLRAAWHSRSEAPATKRPATAAGARASRIA